MNTTTQRHKESLERFARGAHDSGLEQVAIRACYSHKVNELESKAMPNVTRTTDESLLEENLLVPARKRLADYSFRTVEDDHQIAADSYIALHKEKIFFNLLGFLEEKTANRKSVVERLGDTIGAARKILFTVCAPTDLENAREESRKAEEAAEALAADIASAESAVGVFRVAPSLAQFNEAFAAVNCLELS